MNWQRTGPSEGHGGWAASGKPKLVDVHSHLLPGIDDGPATLEGALEMCRAYVRRGFGAVIATPHMSCPGFDVRPDALRSTTRTLREACAQQGLDLDVFPGAEVRLEPDLLDKLESGDVLSLGESDRYVLIELPRQMMPRLDYLGSQLGKKRITPILAHPERNVGIRRCPSRLEELVKGGWLVQVTAGALIGVLGSRAMKAARLFLERGLVHLVATDAHGPAPLSRDRLRSVERCIRSIGGGRTADVLLRVNPERILKACRAAKRGAELTPA